MESRPTVENYQLNPHRHVKIWFSRDEDIFLNPENQLRLVRVRANNPRDTLSFVYDKSLLSAKAQLNLQQFCARHKIEALDIADLKKELVTDREKELMAYVKEEIRRTKNNTGGSFAAASDILRWLSPVYERGIYTDFDTEIKAADLPEIINVQAPVISNIGTIITFIANHPSEKYYEAISACNDFVCMPEPDTSLSIEEQAHCKALQEQQIGLVQQTIIEGYHCARKKLQSFVNRVQAEMEQLIFNKEEQQVFMEISCFNVMALTTGFFGENIFDMRQNIKKVCSSNYQFLILCLAEVIRISPQYADEIYGKLNCTLAEAAATGNFESELRALYQAKLNEALVLADIPERIIVNDEFLEGVQFEVREILLKGSVIKVTGPTVLLQLFERGLFTEQQSKTELHKYSLYNYGLDKSFNCKWAVGLRFSREQSLLAISSQQSDVSWGAKGWAALQEREKEMDSKATLIQTWYRKKLQKGSAPSIESERELPLSSRRAI